jgi:hypothetical protein
MTNAISDDDFIRLPKGHLVRPHVDWLLGAGALELATDAMSGVMIGTGIWYCLRSDYPQPKRVLPSSKTFSSVQEMLDDIHPEFAEEFRAYAKRPSVRLRKWWRLFWMRRRWRSESDRPTREVIDA